MVGATAKDGQVNSSMIKEPQQAAIGLVRLPTRCAALATASGAGGAKAGER